MSEFDDLVRPKNQGESPEPNPESAPDSVFDPAKQIQNTEAADLAEPTGSMPGADMAESVH